MNALIIGAAGFVGKYLTDHLRKERGWSVSVSKMAHEHIDVCGISVYDLDILQKEEIENVLRQSRPDYIFHLAAQSSVALSWSNPALTIDVNIKGAVNVLETVRRLDYKPRILLIGSGEEYGHILESESPISEGNHIRPGNIYAATKACQNMLGKIYADAYNMDVMMVRAFNHIGPGQPPIFVVADFCKQVAEIEAEKREPVIHVGNLRAKRDFTDVRDVVRAYGLLIEKGEKGETYNVGSGRAIEIKELLDKILSQSSAKITVEIDKNRFRPVDVPVIEADIAKIKRCTDWEPEINLDITIKNTLNYWRESTAGL